MTLVLNGTTGVSAVDGSASTPAIQGNDTNTGVFFPAADTVAVATGGTERVRVDSSGNVGIGTTSPGTKLEINTGSSYSGVRLKGTSSASTGFEMTLGSNGKTGYLWNYENDSLLFATNNTERARIDSSGNLLVGTTSAAGSERLNVTGNVANNIARFINSNASPYGPLIQYPTGVDPNGTGNEFIDCRGNGLTLRFSVRSNGGVANFSGNNVNLSDRREKTNFAPAGEYLSKICAIPVQTFNYADQNLEEDPGLTLGVVAQDVQAVAPELVMESNWGSEDDPKMRLSIYQTDLQYALMKCIQELNAKVESLTAEIATLKGAQA